MIDKSKIEKAVKMFIEAIGENPEREGLIETPNRIARMAEELFAGYYDNESKYIEKQFEAQPGVIVMEKDIEFYSLCEHHLMPYMGKVHIAYIPQEKVVGLSKLPRLVEVYARRLQLQERMTNQILDAIIKNVQCDGAMVVVESVHTCVAMRGIKKTQSKTVTMATHGVFCQPSYQSLFYQMLNQKGSI